MGIGSENMSEWRMGGVASPEGFLLAISPGRDSYLVVSGYSATVSSFSSEVGSSPSSRHPEIGMVRINTASTGRYLMIFPWYIRNYKGLGQIHFST
jgi:hypothetical protein